MGEWQVADVDCAGVDADAFNRAAVGRQDEVEAAQIEALGGGGVERQGVTVEAAGKRKPLEEGGVQRAMAEAGREDLRVGDQGEELGRGKEAGDALGNAFAARRG